MRSTAHINGHPIHPMLIPYPFALLTSGVVFDVAAASAEREELAQTAKHLTNAGMATALLAAVPGIVDYFGTVPAKTPASRSATQHALLNVSALACFAIARTTRRENGTLPRSGLTLEVLGAGLMSLAGWLGGELVYREQIGVDDEAPVRTRRLQTTGDTTTQEGLLSLP